MTPSSVELRRCSWEHSRVPSNGTEAGPPPQGIDILPQVVNKTGTRAPRRQQEGKPERQIKGDFIGAHEDKEDTTENRRYQIPDGQDGVRQP